MKKICLLFASMLLGIVLFAQNAYVVNVCGNISNTNGAQPTLLLQYYYSGFSETAYATTDPSGNFCHPIQMLSDSGNSVELNLFIQQTQCQFYVDSFPGLIISSDTSLYSSMGYCQPDGSTSPCAVLFTAYVDSVNTSMIQCNSYPSGTPPFAYIWSFSDGTTSSEANPTLSFIPGFGMAWACVEVIDANGCIANYCDYLNIPTNQDYCSAEFEMYFQDISGNPGEVFFQPGDNNANIAALSWDFGDGTSSNAIYPSVVYDSEGVYTVCLTATFDNGCVDSICQSIYVNPTWWSNNPWTVDTFSFCSANFTAFQAFQDSGVNGMFYLIDLSYGNSLYYTWEFGSGNIINEPYPFVNFNEPSMVDICLTVTDTLGGCQSYYCQGVGVDEWGISVLPSPQPASISGMSEVSMPNPVLSLYPNPASDQVAVSVKLNQADNVNISILDLSGRLVKSSNVSMNKGMNICPFNVKDVPNGIYFIQLNSEQINKVERLIINQ